MVSDTITAPQDLKGKTIAAPFGFTTHFRLLFALEQFGIDPGAVNLMALSPPDLAAAWQRGDIDGGFVWEPALGHMEERLKAQRYAADRIVQHYRDLTTVLLDPDVDDVILRRELLAAVPESDLWRR